MGTLWSVISARYHASLDIRARCVSTPTSKCNPRTQLDMPVANPNEHTNPNSTDKPKHNNDLSMRTPLSNLHSVLIDLTQTLTTVVCCTLPLIIHNLVAIP